MQAEILAIGDELTSGQRLDTNSQWLADQLGRLGIATPFHTTVGDEPTANRMAFQIAVDRSDLIITTGGLGPTADDLTRDVVADLAGMPLVEDTEALAKIEAIFARRNRSMPERNRIQAQFPRGTRVIDNPVGTAPGIDVDVPRSLGSGRGGTCRVICLPGVPAELKRMWADSVLPRLLGALPPGTRPYHHYRVKLFGLGESDVEHHLPDLIARGRDPLVGITVHQATITLRLTTQAIDRPAALAAMRSTLDTIRTSLAEFVFGEEDDELEDAVVRGLLRTNGTLATLEIGGAGLLESTLRRADHGGHTYRGGMAVPSLDTVPIQLDASDENFSLALQSNVESAAALQSLARATARLFGATFGLVLWLPPEGLTVESISTGSVGRVALAAPSGEWTNAFGLFGTRDLIAARSVKVGLDLVRRSLASRNT